jgi:nitrogen fixation NifU-like protein
MVSEALRAAMQLADGAGDLDGGDVREATAEHPICGDVVRVQLRLDAGRVLALAWRASGCPATLAVASIARSALCGHPLAEAKDRLRVRLAALGDLKPHERHAESLVLNAVTEAGRP